MASKVRIAARLRPRLDGEITDDQLKVIHSTDNSAGSSSGGRDSKDGKDRDASYIAVTNPRDPSQVFKVSEEIFRNDVEPLIDVVYSGVTVTIFRTHTMQGTRSDPGVIPRVVQAMFERREEMTQRADLAVSYMEIYKDDVYDLLVQRDNAPKLPVRENDAGMVFVANLSSVPIDSSEEFNTIYNQATRNRSVGSTNLNRASSLTMVDDVANTTLTGKINLESAAINKSLSVLGQVVHALNQGAPRIPYRNSREATRSPLLICNLAPGTKFRQDTLNTLNFASRPRTLRINLSVNERDNRPAPKPHFSAPTSTAVSTKLASASMLQAIAGPSTAASLEIVNNPSMGAGPMRRAARPVPRVSLGGMNMAGGYQSFALPGGGGRRLTAVHERGSMLPVQEAPAPAFSSKDLDERISKAVEAAVEAEVARRLAEKEKEWQEEQRRLEAVIHEKSQEAARRRSRTPERYYSNSAQYEADNSSRDNRDVSQQAQGTSLPAGVLTPILKKHRDLDEQLQERLEELERKFEKGNKETQLADVLSPVSKKKTGRAYVALARAHSEKGDLEVALDLYRKAESYVPDNIKLKERIIEIEWAVKNNTAFVPSPKKPRKQKESKKPKSKLGQEAFGVEVTNTAATSSNENLKELVATKRTYEDSEDPLANKVLFPGTASPITQTPMKRQRRDAVGLVDEL
ncbi:microtubule motor [Coprinopsis sp. MPI-PUGE-AT-0042]|nr:microtubule motor [Coprinopsis sp. MPI-PUGE-AT-0042]